MSAWTCSTGNAATREFGEQQRGLLGRHRVRVQLFSFFFHESVQLLVARRTCNTSRHARDCREAKHVSGTWPHVLGGDSGPELAACGHEKKAADSSKITFGLRLRSSEAHGSCVTRERKTHRETHRTNHPSET